MPPPPPRWTVHFRRGVFYVELGDAVTPPGLALELEVLLVDGDSRAWWLLSETGAVVWEARAGRA